jgi:hypothetical protein
VKNTRTSAVTALVSRQGTASATEGQPPPHRASLLPMRDSPSNKGPTPPAGTGPSGGANPFHLGTAPPPHPKKSTGDRPLHTGNSLRSARKRPQRKSAQYRPLQLSCVGTCGTLRLFRRSNLAQKGVAEPLAGEARGKAGKRCLPSPSLYFLGRSAIPAFF